MSSITSESAIEYHSDDLASRNENLASSDIASSADLSSIASFPVYDVNSNIDISELKKQISQLIKSKGQDLIQACKNYDRRSTYKIPKSQLRQVIRMFCIPVSAVQLEYLLKELKMNMDGKINYHDFFSQLSSTKIPRTSKSLPMISDNVPIDEVEFMIKEKMKNNLRNVIRSFWLFDVNKDGFIQKAELRKVIRNYCFDLSDDVYDNLWKSYDPKLSGLMNYKDFLIRLGVNADRYKKCMPTKTVASSLSWKENKKVGGYLNKRWEQKCKRAALESTDDPAIQGLPLEEIISVFMDRLQEQYRMLMDIFKVLDSEKTREIPFCDFRGIINFFVLAMSTSLFNRVMAKLNIDVSSDKLHYERFLDNFCQSGLQRSTRKSQKLDECAPIVQRIKNHVMNPEARLCSVFTKINADQEWQVTRPELKKALELGLDLKLTDDEFKDLTTILDPANTNIINCADFIHLFQDSCERDCTEKKVLSEPREIFHAEKYHNLKGKKLKSKLKHHLNKNISNIEKAILVCDCDQSSFISLEKLKAILSTFCFSLSDEQFEDIISDVRKYGNSINYHEFFTLFRKSPNEDTQKWITVVDKLVLFKSKCSPEMLMTEVEEMIKECVRFKKTAMLKDFRALDVCHVGVVCKDDFWNILSKFVFRLTSKQFDTLWKTFPRNQYNQLLYDKFLEKYSCVDTLVKPKCLPAQEQNDRKDEETIKEKKVSSQECRRKILDENSKSLAAKSTENRKTTKEIFYSQAPHLKHIFESMEPTMIRNFRAIRYHLRKADPKLTDRVDFVTLKCILAKSDIYFSREDEFHILEHFDTRLTGKINYRDFLRIFIWYT